jgi:hypothetical protein
MSFTVAQMRERVRRKINDSDLLSADNYSDSDINDALYDSAIFTQSVLCDSLDKEDLFLSTTTLTLSGSYLTLPTDLKTIKALEGVKGNYREQIEFVPVGVYNRREQYYPQPYLQAEIVDNTIRFRQTPSGYDSFELRYIFEIQNVASGATFGLKPQVAELFCITNCALELLRGENAEDKKLEKEVNKYYKQLVDVVPVQAQNPRHVNYNPV